MKKARGAEQASSELIDLRLFEATMELAEARFPGAFVSLIVAKLDRAGRVVDSGAMANADRHTAGPIMRAVTTCMEEGDVEIPRH